MASEMLLQGVAAFSLPRRFGRAFSAAGRSRMIVDRTPWVRKFLLTQRVKRNP